MRFIHTMIRVRDIAESLDFWCDKMGLVETRRVDNEQGRFTLIFLAAPADEDAGAMATHAPELELTYNWGSEEVYKTGRSWGHLAYRVDDIYAFCARLAAAGGGDKPPAPRWTDGVCRIPRRCVGRADTRRRGLGGGRAVGFHGECWGVVGFNGERCDD